MDEHPIIRYAPGVDPRDRIAGLDIPVVRVPWMPQGLAFITPLAAMQLAFEPDFIPADEAPSGVVSMFLGEDPAG